MNIIEQYAPEGVKFIDSFIINEYGITFLGILTTVFVAIPAILCIICAIYEIFTEKEVKFIVLELTIGVIFLLFFIWQSTYKYSIWEKDIYDYYQVEISEDVDINELYKNFDIVEQRGISFIIKQKRDLNYKEEIKKEVTYSCLE